jgi:hypothetical protein
MLRELRFVQGAVAKKDLVPSMKHFCIEKGTIRAYNGSLGLCSPIALDIDCKPKARELVQAIAHCSEEYPMTLSLLPNGKLRILNGPYKTTIECIDEETPHVHPAGEFVHFTGTPIRQALMAVEPFIGNDASRLWANGVLLSDKSCFATNNVCLVEYWIGTQLPFTINLPHDAVDEIIRIQDEPTHAQLTENSITFHYADGRWIRSGLYEKEQVSIFKKILEADSNPKPIAENFFHALQSIKPFVNKQNEVYFRNGAIWTSHDDEGSAASYELLDFQHKGCYALPMLELLKGTMHSIDLSLYPAACMFFGDNLRGAIIGRWISNEEREADNA